MTARISRTKSYSQSRLAQGEMALSNFEMARTRKSHAENVLYLF